VVPHRRNTHSCSRGVTPDDLARAVRLVAEGESLLAPSLKGKLTEELVCTGEVRAALPPEVAAVLLAAGVITEVRCKVAARLAVGPPFRASSMNFRVRRLFSSRSSRSRPSDLGQSESSWHQPAPASGRVAARLIDFKSHDVDSTAGRDSRYPSRDGSRSGKGSTVQGSEGVIEALNKLLALQLAAVNQYFAHSKMCENWGFDRLARHLRETSLEEMKDAEEIIHRILFLEGAPQMEQLDVSVGGDVATLLRADLDTETRAIRLLHDGISAALDDDDQASREFFALRLPEEEGHADWLETQLSLIDELGQANYLAQQLRD
jgi:bacterioferritin